MAQLNRIFINANGEPVALSESLNYVTRRIEKLSEGNWDQFGKWIEPETKTDLIERLLELEEKANQVSFLTDATEPLPIYEE